MLVWCEVLPITSALGVVGILSGISKYLETIISFPLVEGEEEEDDDEEDDLDEEVIDEEDDEDDDLEGEEEEDGVDDEVRLSIITVCLQQHFGLLYSVFVCCDPSDQVSQVPVCGQIQGVLPWALAFPIQKILTPSEFSGSVIFYLD